MTAVPVLAAVGLTSEQLLLFWVQLAVLLIAARLLGALARRWGQPAVVGELSAGIVLGPSLLGRIAPGVHDWLFRDDLVQTGLLLAVSWIGVSLLLVITGFETDLRLLRRLGRSSALVATGSMVLPLAAGAGLALVLPDAFVGGSGDRLGFVLFIAVAMSVSALPVIAKVLMDLGLMRRNLGQVTLAAGMANDLVGWILLGFVAGIVGGGGMAAGTLVSSVGGVLVFLVLALTVGQRLVDAALRRTRARTRGTTPLIGVALTVMVVAGAITQALGVEAVLGAFVAGIVLGRSRYQDRAVEESLAGVTTAFFAPIFFATAGLSVDLGLLVSPGAALAAGAVILVAALGKLGGTYIGGVLGGLARREALAIGAGLNARGALEIIVATIGLSLGVLTDLSFTVIVVMALATSMMAGPMLTWILRGHEVGDEEAARLEREALLDASVIAGTERALLPTRGGTNSLLAGRVLDLVLQPESHVTVLTVHGRDDPVAAGQGATAAKDLTARLDDHVTNWIDRAAEDPADAICAESELGYGLVALGMTVGASLSGAPSDILRSVLANCRVPLLLVRAGPSTDPDAPNLGIRRIVVPATGTRAGQAAQEVAFTLASRVDAEVDVVHVVTRPEPVKVEVGAASRQVAFTAAADVLQQARDLAGRFGRRPGLHARRGPASATELVQHAEATDADLLVLGVQLRPSEARPFLGHGVEHLLEDTDRAIALVIFPP